MLRGIDLVAILFGENIVIIHLPLPEHVQLLL